MSGHKAAWFLVVPLGVKCKCWYSVKHIRIHQQLDPDVYFISSPRQVYPVCLIIAAIISSLLLKPWDYLWATLKNSQADLIRLDPSISAQFARMYGPLSGTVL